MKNVYSDKNTIELTIDCIIFGFDKEKLMVLLQNKTNNDNGSEWGLISENLTTTKSAEDTAFQLIKNTTDVQSVYLEQLQLFSQVDRHPKKRIISLSFIALIDILKSQKQIQKDASLQWFSIDQLPSLMLDHKAIIEVALDKLRYKAALHPILFELLPAKFTIPHLQHLYEELYKTAFDKGNFSKKVFSTGLLVKMKEKDKLSSKKGAYYFKLDKKKYQSSFNTFLNFVNKPDL